jgi:hypothetical protein
MIGLVAVGTAATAFVTLNGEAMSQRSSSLWLVSFSYSVAWWVEADRRSRRVPAPFEYAAFMFALWPFMLPHYLFKTRRWRGLALGIGIFLFSCIPDLTSVALYMLFGED